MAIDFSFLARPQQESASDKMLRSMGQGLNIVQSLNQIQAVEQTARLNALEEKRRAALLEKEQMELVTAKESAQIMGAAEEGGMSADELAQKLLGAGDLAGYVTAKKEAREQRLAPMEEAKTYQEAKNLVAKQREVTASAEKEMANAENQRMKTLASVATGILELSEADRVPAFQDRFRSLIKNGVVTEDEVLSLAERAKTDDGLVGLLTEWRGYDRVQFQKNQGTEVLQLLDARRKASPDSADWRSINNRIEYLTNKSPDIDTILFPIYEKLSAGKSISQADASVLLTKAAVANPMALAIMEQMMKAGTIKNILPIEQVDAKFQAQRKALQAAAGVSDEYLASTFDKYNEQERQKVLNKYGIK